jgi:hypothetical protein
VLERGTEGGDVVVVLEAKTEMGSGGEFFAALAGGQEMLAAAFSGCSGFRRGVS